MRILPNSENKTISSLNYCRTEQGKIQVHNRNEMSVLLTLNIAEIVPKIKLQSDLIGIGIIHDDHVDLF